MEQWKTLERMPKYEVSDKGRVRSLHGLKPKILNQVTSSSGYKLVCLSAGGKRHTSYIHRLVAEVFIPVENLGNSIVNHKDRNRLNNSIDNLEWITVTDNMFHWKESDRYEITRSIAAECDKMSMEQLKKVLDFCKHQNL